MDAGQTLADDPTIPDSELLNRRIPWPCIHDGDKIASIAFTNRDDSDPHVSVDLSSLSTPEQTLARWPAAAGVAQVPVIAVRQVTPGVVRDPLEDNPAHALIIGRPGLSRHKWKEIARKFAKACVWAIAPKS